jgi:hypothetical protein
VALPCIVNWWVCHDFSLRNWCCLNMFPVSSDLQHRPYRYPDLLPSFVIKVGFLQVLCQVDNAKAAEPEKCVEEKTPPRKVPVHNTTAYRGSSNIDLLILNLSTRQWCVVSCTIRRPYSTWKSPLYQLSMRLAQSQGWSWCFGEENKLLLLPGWKHTIFRLLNP